MKTFLTIAVLVLLAALPLLAMPTGSIEQQCGTSGASAYTCACCEGCYAQYSQCQSMCTMMQTAAGRSACQSDCSGFYTDCRSTCTSGMYSCDTWGVSGGIF